MAWMNQEKKTKIAAALKLVVPSEWKWTLAVRNRSTIFFTVRSAPVDLLAKLREGRARPSFGGFVPSENETHGGVNHNHIARDFADEALLVIFAKINTALNLDNYDNSDSQSDYFDVGHYVSIRIGQWDRPFVVTQSVQVAA